MLKQPLASEAPVGSFAVSLLAAGAAGVAMQRRQKARCARRLQKNQVVTPEEMRPGRRVVVRNEAELTLDIASASVESMDAFMKENAAEVCLQNLERMEAKPGDPEVKFCYIEPNDVGPYRSQIRMEIKVEVVESGKCDIQILEMIAGGVDKKTGKADFEDNINKIEMEAENSISWKSNGRGGLEVVNFNKSQSFVKLPWWFPIPDAIVEKVVTFFIGQVISTGHRKVNAQIAEKFAEWQRRVGAA